MNEVCRYYGDILHFYLIKIDRYILVKWLYDVKFYLKACLTHV